jgi:hypothetical protein
MKTLEEKKSIALSLLAPYYINPNICGIQFLDDAIDTPKKHREYRCSYVTQDGNMCIGGSAMNEEFRNSHRHSLETIDAILSRYEQSEVFKPELVDVFSENEWVDLQNAHDSIACDNESVLDLSLDCLGLFSLDDLKQYVLTL